jgi:lysophospholipase L1-like esterase
LVFGKWFDERPSLMDLGVVKNKSYTIDIQGLYEGEKEIRYTRDAFGLRGNRSHNNPASIKILCVGGSTTDQRYIDDSQTWQTVLETELLTKNPMFFVANAGVDGQSTLGHIANFEHWFAKIKDLKPAYVLYYIGINDAFRFNKQQQEEALRELMNGPGKEYEPQRRFPYHKSAFYSLYALYKGNREADKLQLRHHKLDLSKATYTQTPMLGEDFYKGYDTLMQQFTHRLRVLDSLTKTMGAKSVFVSQATNHYAFSEEGVKGVATHFTNDRIVFNGMDAYYLISRTHQQIQSFCADSILFINGYDGVGFQSDDFYDYVHLNPQGARKLGLHIAQAFAQLQPK